MEKSKIHIVVNPTAGSGKANKVVNILLEKIRTISDSDINLTYTKEKNDAISITREAIENNAKLIIAVGGDGTINEVVNGFFKEGNQLNPSCELGIINCGTGKGYASALNTPESIDQQIELLFQPVSTPVDLGRITFKDHSDKRISRLFVNECQVGIGSNVTAIVGKNFKIFGGKIAFGLAATIQAIIMKPLNLKIKYDNEPFQESRLIGLVVGNGTECAGGMKLTPDAKLNDGFFDVLSMHAMSVIQRLLNLSKVYSGTHILTPYFSIRRCKKLTIQSDIEISLEADGEILGYSPFDIEILPAAIRVKANINKA